jgi:hypothetical protein
MTIDCGGIGSGCYGLRYRFGNPHLNVIANEVKQSQKELTLPNKRLLRASPIAMTTTNEGEAVPASPPFASLTQLTSFPSLLKKRGAIRKHLFTIVPPL